MAGKTAPLRVHTCGPFPDDFFQKKKNVMRIFLSMGLFWRGNKPTRCNNTSPKFLPRLYALDMHPLDV